MDVRNTINKHAVPALLFVGGIALVTLIFAVLQTRRSAGAHLKVETQAFYTTDDGASLFMDDARKVPPFDHDGQAAVRAYVYTSDGGKTQWVHYLEKYEENAEKQAVERGAAPGTGGLLVKKPGSQQWLPSVSRGAMEILSLKRPDGKPGNIQPVMP